MLSAYYVASLRVKLYLVPPTCQLNYFVFWTFNFHAKVVKMHVVSKKIHVHAVLRKIFFAQ